MNRWLADIEVRLVLGGSPVRRSWLWLRGIVNALLTVKNFLLEELEVLAENFDCQAIQVNCLTAGFINAMRLLLDFLVLKNHILLNGEHLVAVTLNGNQFIIWLGLLDLEEYLEDLMILVLHIEKSQFLLLVLSDKADQLATLLNLVQRLDKLVGEVFNPFDVLILDLYKRVSNALFPFADD